MTADHRIKAKEVERLDKYLDIASEKLCNMKVMTIVVEALEIVPQELGKETE